VIRAAFSPFAAPLYGFPLLTLRLSEDSPLYAPGSCPIHPIFPSPILFFPAFSVPDAWLAFPPAIQGTVGERPLCSTSFPNLPDGVPHLASSFTRGLVALRRPPPHSTSPRPPHRVPPLFSSLVPFQLFSLLLSADSTRRASARIIHIFSMILILSNCGFSHIYIPFSYPLLHAPLSIVSSIFFFPIA